MCSTFFGGREGPSAELALSGGPPPGPPAQFFALDFLSPNANVPLCSLSWGSSRGIVVAVQGRNPPAFGFSGIIVCEQSESTCNPT